MVRPLRAIVAVLRRFGPALAALGCTAVAAASAAERFPDRPIRLIVAFAPGTGSDSVARAVATPMGAALGQTVIVDNRAGAGGTIGTEHGARAAPDGYTLTLATTSTLLTHPVLNPNAHYGAAKDFVPVAGVARTAFVLVTANSVDAPRSLLELKRRLGRTQSSFGSAGIGTVGHLACENVLREMPVTAVHVPYRGSVQALSDVAGGHLLFACDTVAAALPLIRAGRLRALAVSSAQRLAALPEVPTGAQAGVPAFRLSAWWGIVAPSGTPPAVLALLSDAALKTLAEPQVQQQLDALQLEVMPLAAAPFGEMLRAETPIWADFARRSGVRLE